ncbi:protein of unknown function [Tenacibaculum sp. 190130A14a]|uniref:Transposase n=1 Tax=Tenacibaculum polynesiense TaxID=3137857 RepID=A0ABP1F0L5_9FLAO
MKAAKKRLKKEKLNIDFNMIVFVKMIFKVFSNNNRHDLTFPGNRVFENFLDLVMNMVKKLSVV